MQSTYDQFVKTFKEDLHRVAEFEGEADQTLSVIVGALESAKLKQLLDELDILKQKVDRSEKVKPDEPVKRGGRSKKAVTDSDVVEEGTETKPTKAVRRVTGYNVFVAEQVREKKSTMKDAAAVWKTMDDATRAVYMERATAQNAA